MKNIELNSNVNAIDYIIDHIDELKDSRIMLPEIDKSKYGFIESKKCEVYRNLIGSGNIFELAVKDPSEMYVIDFEYFLKGRKDVSMLVRETTHTGLWKPPTRQLLKVFKNHDYKKTLFETSEMSAEDSIYLINSKAKKSAFLTDGIFVVSKKDCVSDFIVKNKERFEGKSIIITDDELKRKYLGFPKQPTTAFNVTPHDYMFEGQQNVVNMRLVPVEGAPGNYYVNNIVKNIHIATPVYDSINANDANLINISETKLMTK